MKALKAQKHVQYLHPYPEFETGKYDQNIGQIYRLNTREFIYIYKVKNLDSFKEIYPTVVVPVAAILFRKTALSSGLLPSPPTIWREKNYKHSTPRQMPNIER